MKELKMSYVPYMTCLDFPEIEGYTVERRPLHFGTDASVYEATRHADDRKVAIKLVPRERYSDEARFSEILSKHPGFMPVLEIRWLEEFVMLVFPYMAGGDLLTLVRQEGPLTSMKTVDILQGVLTALAFAHSIDISLVDVTIENVLFEEISETSFRVKLCDYDQCVFVDPINPLVPWSGLVTRRTRPPELYRRVDYDPRKLDIFGVGVMAALMCSLPKNHSKIITQLAHVTRVTHDDDLITAPSVLRGFINALLAYDPAKRPDISHALVRLREVKACLEQRSSAHDAKLVDDFFEKFGTTYDQDPSSLARLIAEADAIDLRIATDLNVSCT